MMSSFMPRSARLVAVLVALAMLGACSSAGRKLVNIQKLEDIPADKVAALDVVLPDQQTDAVYVQAASLIRQQLTGRLIAERIFEAVEETSDNADYTLEVKILNIQMTSPGARAMLGVMAPRSGIDVAVKVQEKASERLITSLNASGYGSRMWMSAQGYGLDDPVREVVKQIVNALR